MGPPSTQLIEIPLRLLGYTRKDRSPLWGLHLGDRSALTHTAVLFILRTVGPNRRWGLRGSVIHSERSCAFPGLIGTPL